MYLVASSRGVVNPIAMTMTNIGKTVQYASSLLVHNVNNKYSKNMKSTKLQRDILRWEYESETMGMYSPPSPIEWLENKLIELRKHAVVGQSEQLVCDSCGCHPNIVTQRAGGSLTPFGESIKLLRDLADLQNGAPLEQYRKEWEETMKQVYDFLDRWEGQCR